MTTSTLYPTPIYRITVNDKDISDTIASRLISMSIKDNRGIVVDSIDITLDDSDNALEIPSLGATVKVWLGWSDTGMVYKGSYLVTSISHSGAPDTLSISAESSDLAEAFRQKRERSFHGKTIVEIINIIALDYQLTAKVHDSLANRVIKHIDQSESDANIISRIAFEYDAIATVKDKYLLFMPMGSSQTASGLDLPKVELIRSEGDQHNYSIGQSNNNVSAVKAYYYDPKDGKKKHVIIGTTEDNPKEIRYIHRDKQSAELAAKAEFNRIRRDEMTLSYTLAKGKPDLIPEQQITFVGLKTQIDDIVWHSKTVTHDISDGGYTTKLELEIQMPNADDLSTLYQEDEDHKITKKEANRRALVNANYTGVKAYYVDGKTKKNQSILVGSGQKPRILTHLYKSKGAAKKAAEREYQKLLALKKKNRTPPTKK